MIVHLLKPFIILFLKYVVPLMVILTIIGSVRGPLGFILLIGLFLSWVHPQWLHPRQ